MPAHPLVPAAPLDYHTPDAEFLDPHPPRHGLASLVNGAFAAASTYLFLLLRTSSPLSPAILVTFPLVAAIPIFGLTAVSHGLDAVALRRRQSVLAIPGLILSLVSMAVLARALVLPP